MNWLVIEGMKPYDGRYEFDLDNNELTTREWGWIKRLSGYLPLTVGDGLEGADPELFACFAVLMLRRAGKISNTDVQEMFDRLADAPFGTTIRLETDDQEEAEADDAGPPAGSSTGNAPSSGDGSPVNSESSGPPRSGIGTPVWASSAFDQLTSGT